MRWISFTLLALTSAALSLYFQDVLRAYAPELIFLFMFHVGLHCRQVDATVGWWWCGIIRDFSIGTRLGVSAILFLLLGGILLSFRRRVKREHASTQILLVFVMVFVFRLTEPLLAWGTAPIADWGVLIKSCVVSAAFTGVLSLPWALTIARLRIYRPDHELIPAFSAGGSL